MQDFGLTLSNGRLVASISAADSLPGNVLLSLYVRKGSWFRYPEFGSDLYLINRVTEDNIALAEDYAREALQWLVDLKRLTAVEVSAEADGTDRDRINIAVACTRANGAIESLNAYFRVV